MEIPLKRKYRVHKPVKMNRSKHNDGHKKRGNGWAKHRYGNRVNHVPYVMVLDLPTGKCRFMSRDEWEAQSA